jgi:putative membrane protein
MRVLSLCIGLAALAAVWGPLSGLARTSFTTHMGAHLIVVALAAPLIAAALPRLRLPGWAGAAVIASLVEFAVVWGWHAPMLHEAARASSIVFAAEQVSFLCAGLLLWITALGGDARDETRTLAGMTGLLLTSMHMTLLGALIALATRPLFAHHAEEPMVFGLTTLQDQQLGGALMIAVGGVAYLIGGLVLASRLLRHDTPFATSARTGDRP